MYEDYIADLIKTKLDLEAIEEKVIYEKGNIPDIKKLGAMMTPIKEMIIKFCYITMGFFKSDYRLLFAFSYDSQTIDKNLKDLEQDGYLLKQDTPYGNLYGLTKEAIALIRCNPRYYLGDRKGVNLQDMKLDGETAYQKRKLMSYNVAYYVFRTQLLSLYRKYASTDKVARNMELAKIYLKNIRYRDYLKMDKEDRKKALVLIGFTHDEADTISEKDTYISKYAEQYAERAFSHIGFDSLRKEQEYRDYIAYVKKHCICKEPDYETFYLLRDFQDTYDYKELEIIKDWKCNITRFGLQEVWKAVKGNDLILYMRQLEQCNKYLSILGNEVRSLTATNVYKKKTDEKELREIMAKLSLLDSRITELRKIKERLETEFSFPVITAYFEGATESEMKPVTITRLTANGVYLELDRENHITIKVIQQQEEIDLFSLHKKIGMGFMVARRLFPLCQFDVAIYAYDDEQIDYINSILSRLTDKLKSNRETALIGSIIEDSHSIIAGRSKLEERYIFFNAMYEELKTPESFEAMQLNEIIDESASNLLSLIEQ